MDIDLIIVAIYSYLLGSIPFGLLLTRIFLKKDIRTVGSGNIGTTNVLRTGNKFLAITTLVLDLLKGYISVYITIFYFRDFTSYSALICFIGHIFPLWLRFKGGKGVATYLGIILAISYKLFFIFGITWLIISLLFRFASLSSKLGQYLVYRSLVKNTEILRTYLEQTVSNFYKLLIKKIIAQLYAASINLFDNKLINMTQIFAETRYTIR